jgi:hypothetical protein
MQLHAQDESTQSAQHIAELTNRDRAAQGLPPLEWNPALATAAQAHAQLMAQQQTLSHQYPGEPDMSARIAQAGVRFDAADENIAYGYSDDQVENEWMHSPPHRANILDPHMNAIGVAVVKRGNTLYAVEDFAGTVQSLTPQQVESRIDALLRQRGIDPSVPRQSASMACDSGREFPQGVTGRLLLRFDTANLNQLPATAASQIQKGSYSKASVAACPQPSQQNSVPAYRVAIVLY